MQSLPTPCPADRIPDATGLDAFTTTYSAAKEQRAVFVAIERQGPGWTVKADALTAPQRTLDSPVYGAVRDAVSHLIGSRQIRPDSFADPVYVVLYDVDGEGRARELAAAVHAAFSGDLEPLSRAAPCTS
ncbi:hypothetical protein [Streptomyces sp. CB02261]|uniref:hypothetical protein n=1 Tax=Streptomyces sp. CB02261 TaxID=1703940 RepID=UPI00093E9817|nr:hypothetical protein [Streptomyces sp. CB02261]OKJ52745.1 hypothetical protein AMK29_30855 [Streptomyces sp. CB02261]